MHAFPVFTSVDVSVFITVTNACGTNERSESFRSRVGWSVLMKQNMKTGSREYGRADCLLVPTERGSRIPGSSRKIPPVT